MVGLMLRVLFNVRAWRSVVMTMASGHNRLSSARSCTGLPRGGLAPVAWLGHGLTGEKRRTKMDLGHVLHLR